MYLGIENIVFVVLKQGCFGLLHHQCLWTGG
jgi:hypothetical protein